MAILTDEQREEEWADFMYTLSNAAERLDLNKPELRAAINATDDWIEANSASFNNALPAAAKAALTAKQKTRLFMAVARKRFGVA